MKKLSLSLILAFAISCGDAEMFIEPEGSDYAVSDIVGEESSDDSVFLILQQSPSFPGGKDAYSEFLTKNLKYPEKALAEGVEGNVYLSFVVNKDGILSDFEVLKSPGSDLAEAALLVYMEGPNWIPGRQKDKIVNSKVTARVSFSLAEATPTTNNAKDVEVTIFETPSEIR